LSKRSGCVTVYDGDVDVQLGANLLSPLPPPAEPVPLDPPVPEPDGDTLAWTLPQLNALADESARWSTRITPTSWVAFSRPAPR
jgi:hypothetical protein